MIDNDKGCFAHSFETKISQKHAIGLANMAISQTQWFQMDWDQSYGVPPPKLFFYTSILDDYFNRLQLTLQWPPLHFEHIDNFLSRDQYIHISDLHAAHLVSAIPPS